MEIVTERVRIALAGGEEMGGYLARPKAGGARPAVLVFMEIFGVNSHIRDVTERVAREGYVALAPDYFHRTGAGVEYDYDPKGLAAGMKLLGALKSAEMIADAKGAIAWLRSRDDVRGNRIGAIGFCIGGHMTYLTACETDVRASASFYGGGIAAAQGPGGGTPTIDRTSKIAGTIVCFFGGRDGMIPATQVDAIREALVTSGVRHHIQVYPEADHGFFCDQRATFDPAAAEDAWRRVKELFASELGS
jgi:carboxymethylenebutenolidase